MRSTSPSFWARAIVSASLQRAPSLIGTVAATHVGECESQGKSEELPAQFRLPAIFEERNCEGIVKAAFSLPLRAPYIGDRRIRLGFGRAIRVCH